MSYEALMLDYPELTIKEKADMPKGLSGLYYDNNILINRRKSLYEKHFVLAEELGHYETTYGNISYQTKISNRKLEVIARRWGYERIFPKKHFITFFKKRNMTIEDISMEFEITPNDFKIILDFYKEKYGTHVFYKDYIIHFEPLIVEKRDRRF